MSILTIMDTLLIGPLKLLFEIIFVIANRFLSNPGLSIIALSLMMNILVLPLYRRADAMQEESRDVEARLAHGVSHIKKVFSGDERMMILQTYYRQNHYKPTDALRGSVSLLLEVPFFMAAYQLLSNAQILNGASLGPIFDLGAPDGLIVIGSITLNALPVLMTLINVISSAIYLKGFPLKTKIQLYGMALFFLVFLYTSPSGLVFYWTLNNLFSLVKTIFYKLKNPEKILKWLLCIAGAAILCYGCLIYDTPSLKRRLFVIGIGVLCLFPLAFTAIRPKLYGLSRQKGTPNQTIFLLGSLFLTLQVGLLIPSTYIASSPLEYIDPSYYHNPLWYIVSALCLSAGTFLIWMRVFYWLASAQGKVIFDRLVWILCGVFFINYMFYGTDLGNISSSLQYEQELLFTTSQQLSNLLVLAAAGIVMYYIYRKWNRSVKAILLTAIIALGSMSMINAVKINTVIKNASFEQPVQSKDTLRLELSKTGQNVVVIMLDRAQGMLVPYMFEEKPHLKEQFSGFTYYSNTISYGNSTKIGAPPALGGYEYTPVEMNRENNKTLCQKHNEALLLMPSLFLENGYDVTIWDPPYPGYQKIPDLSVYSDYPEIEISLAEGAFTEDIQKQYAIDNNYRNFFCFSIMKSMPLCTQWTIYYNGLYNQMPSDIYLSQATESSSRAVGISKGFMEKYDVLRNLPSLTEISDDQSNAFIHITNNITHEPTLLQMPDYVPAAYIDNTEYDKTHADRFMLNGNTLDEPNTQQMAHYHSNMATMLQLGNWFDYLREQGIYDNTRIILVADHGWYLSQESESLIHDDGSDPLMNVSSYFPLLMVKDFNAEGFYTSDEFMTNADVPSIAMKDLIANPTNPFTGKPVDTSAKNAHEQFILMSWEKQFDKDGSTAFGAAQWASVSNNIWNKENWDFHEDIQVLTEHQFP